MSTSQRDGFENKITLHDGLSYKSTDNTKKEINNTLNWIIWKCTYDVVHIGLLA